MATPVNFPGINIDVVMDGLKVPTSLQNGVMTSVWQCTDEEIQQIAETGCIQLTIVPQPPGMPAMMISPYRGDPAQVQVQPYEHGLN